MKGAEKTSFHTVLVEGFRSIVSHVLKELTSNGRFTSVLRDTTQFYLSRFALFKARVLENNRITIPKEEADILGLKPGDYVFVILTKIERGGGRR